jgi:hypothetical protein
MRVHCFDFLMWLGDSGDQAIKAVDAMAPNNMRNNEF